MKFNHVCLTDAEARAKENEMRREIGGARFLAGMRRSNALFLAALFMGVCALLAFYFSNTSTGDFVLVTISGALAVATVVCAVLAFMDQVLEEDKDRRRFGVEQDFREAYTHDLVWLKETADAREEIRAAVRQWLADGKTIRNRDVDAVRRHVNRATPHEARAAALAALAPTTAAE